MRKHRLFLRLLAVFMGLSFGVHAAPPQWTVLDGSTVGFVAYQAGAPVEGVFETFEAQIHFDPDDPVRC